MNEYLLKKTLFEAYEQKENLANKLIIYRKFVNEIREQSDIENRERFILSDVENLINRLYCEFSIIELQIDNLKNLINSQS
jgi:hypothetical protein